MDVSDEEQDADDLSFNSNNSDTIENVGRTSLIDRKTFRNNHVELSSHMDPERDRIRWSARES